MPKTKLIGIFRDKVPVNESTPSDPDHISGICKKAGLTVKFLNAQELADPEILNAGSIDILILPYGSSFPAEAVDNLKKFLKKGGSFISTGGYVFDNFYSAATGKAEGGNLIENPGFEEGLDGWQISKPPDVNIDQDLAIKHGGKASLIFEVPDEVPAGWFGPSIRLEIGDGIKAGDVLRAAIFIKTKDVRDAAGVYLAFNFFKSSGERITWDQSGALTGTNDWTEMQLLSRPIPAGTAYLTFNPLLYGHGVAWFDDVKIEKSAPGLNTRFGKAEDALGITAEQIPVFDAAFKLENAVVLRSEPDQFVIDKGIEMSGNFTGYAATAMISQDNNAVFPMTARRWVPLVTCFDKYGRSRGTAGALVYNYKGTYKNSCWAYFGINNTDIFEPLKPLSSQSGKILADIIKAMRQRTFLCDLGSGFACYRQGEDVEINVKAVNQGSESQKLQVKMQISNCKMQNVYEETEEETLEAGRSTNLTFTWKGGKFDSDLYNIKVTLYSGNKTIDAMESGFTVWDENIIKNGIPVTMENNYFRVGEKPFFVCGTNYTGVVFVSNAENPWVLEQDFRKMQDSGLTCIRVLHFGIKNFFPDFLKPKEKVMRRLDALVQLCQKHKVTLLQTVHDWLEVNVSDKDLNAQKEFCRMLSERYKGVPGIRWDIQNEPSWSSYDPRPTPDINREYNTFLAEKYTTAENWQEKWGDEAKGEFGSLKFDAKCGQNWDNIKAYDLRLFRRRLFQRWIDGNFQGLTASRRYNIDVSGAEAYDQVLWENIDATAIHFYDSWKDFPQRLKYADQRYRGIPFGDEEFGQKVHPAWGGSGPATPKVFPPAIDHFLALGHYTLGLGGYGLLNWDWKDMQECLFLWGLNFNDRLVSKPTLTAFRNMSLLFRTLQPVYEAPEVYFVIPDSHRLGAKAEIIERVILNGLKLLISTHLDFGVINEFNLSRLPKTAKVLMYPVPFCPEDTAYSLVRDFVKKGGTLYVSGDISFDDRRRRTRTQRLSELCGVEFQEENYQNISYSTGSAEQVSGAGLVSYQGYPCIKVKPKTARNLGGSVIFENKLGSGRVLYVTDPYELHARENSLYKFFLKWAGVQRNEITPDNPKIHFFRVPLTDGGTAYVMMNADEATQDISFKHGDINLAMTLGRYKSGLVAIAKDGKIFALETSGKIKAGNDIIADFTGQGMAFSLDSEDIRSSSAVVLMPVQAGKFSLKCKENLTVEFGEVRSGKWQVFNVAAGLVPALSISPDQTDCHFLFCAGSEQAKWRAAFEKFVNLE